MISALDLLERTAPVISVNGSDLSAAMMAGLVQARVELGLGVIGRVTLRFVDPDHAIATGATFALGSKVQVKIAQQEIAAAYVTGAMFSQDNHAQPEFVVTADDAAYKLTRKIAPATYEQMTYSDVIIKLAGECGLSANVTSTTEQHPYQLISGSPLAYLDTITRRIGQVWWMSANDTLVTKDVDDISDTVEVVAEDLNSLSIRESAMYPSDVTASGWDITKKSEVAGNAGGQRNGTFDDGPMGRYGKTASLPSSASSQLSGLNPITTTEAGLVSKALLTEVIDSSRVLRGESMAHERFMPGKKLKIAESNAFAGEFLLSSVEHIYRPGKDFITRFVAGPHRPPGLVEALGNPVRDPGLHHLELVAAVVTNCADPDNLGRVKVKYLGIPGEIESGWARIATVGAGLNRGIVFFPEINDEVLVGFEGGDMRRPVVLGGLYNGKDTPPTEPLQQTNGKTNARRLISRSGNFVEFSDGDNDTENHVKIAMKGGSELRVGKDETTLKQSKPLKITVGSASIEIDDSGNVKITGDTISIKATKDLTLEGMSVTVKASQKVALSGLAGEFKTNGQLNLESTGQTALKGAMVMIN